MRRNTLQPIPKDATHVIEVRSTHPSGVYMAFLIEPPELPAIITKMHTTWDRYKRVDPREILWTAQPLTGPEREQWENDHD